MLDFIEIFRSPISLLNVQFLGTSRWGGGVHSLERTSLCKISLLNREKTGKFNIFDHFAALNRRKFPETLALELKFPKKLTGNFISLSGNR
jgi:hypothetical protein